MNTFPQVGEEAPMSTSKYPYYGSEAGSLISEITQHFTPDVVRSARSMIGESESSTYQALHVATPTVLSGIANMASSSEGASNLTSMIRDGGYGGVAENPMSLFRGGSATNYLLSAGQRHLGRIFGANASSVTELVAKSSGVSVSSASKLMSLVTPLTLGVLGKRIAGQGPGSSGVSELLSRQRDEIATAAPTGLSRILGLGPRAVPAPVTSVEPVASVEDEEEEVLDSPTHIEHFTEPTPVAERPRVEPTPFPERRPLAVSQPREGGGLRWLPFTLLLLGAIALLGYLLSRARAPRVGDLTSRAANSATNALARVPLPGGVSLSVPRGSINDQLAGFLGDNSATGVPRTFVFDHLNFVSGSTELTPDSGKTVSDLAQVLKAYPSAQVQLGGHTDNTGNTQDNQTLSLNRANAVRTMLVSDGVAADRISTQGYGQERPIASNDTEQGRAQNRRTELTVTQK
jgi:OmpA-OmpF porin, OOP family